MENNNPLVVFDFDKTLTHKDTILGFYVECNKNISLLWKAPYFFAFVFLYLIKIISNDKLKKQGVKIFLKGKSQKYLLQIGEQYAKKIKFNKVYETTFLKNYPNAIISSASFSEYLQFIFNPQNLFASELNYNDNNICQGLNKNMYGHNKLLAFYKKNILTLDIFYTDSYSDKPLMDISKSIIIVNKNSEKIIKKVCVIFLFFCFHTQQNFGQKLVIKNLISDFGAIPGDNLNDSKAFEKAANFINKIGGNVKLFIPKGKYWVGNNQKEFCKSIDIFKLEDCKNVEIVGEKGAVVSYIDGLYFGMFDTIGLKKPLSLNLYNPASLDNEIHKTEGTDAYVKFSRFAKDIGTFFSLKFCTNIKIENLFLLGNSSNFILGSYWGVGSRPYERTHYGIWINNSNQVSVNNCEVSLFGTDAIVVTSYPYSQKEKNNFTTDVQILNCKFNKSGRNNFSLSGGKNIKVVNCEFSYAATTKICTSPGSGISIEPEFNKVSNVLFDKCKIYGNIGFGITDGYLIDTNIVYKNCKISSSSSYALICGSVKSVYENCIFSGVVFSVYNATNLDLATKFINCHFNDKACKNGECFEMYLIGIKGNMQQFYNCSFNSKYLPLLYVDIEPQKRTDFVFFDGCNFLFTGKKAPVLGNYSAFLNNTILKNSNFYFNKLYPPNFMNNKSNTWENVSLNNLKIGENK